MNKLTSCLIYILLLTGCSSLDTLNALMPDGDSTRVSNIGYGDHLRQRLDIHQPPEPYVNAPVIIFFYGGRWQAGARQDYHFVGQSLANRGFITVIPDYRLVPDVEFPDFITDGAKVIAWVLNNIQLYGGDPANVFLMGHSAGAHTAAMLTANKSFLTAQGVSSQRISGLIGLSGPYDFAIKDDDIKRVFKLANTYEDTQPIHFIDGTEPPMLLLHGYKDKTVLPKNSLHMAAKSIKMGGSADIFIYEDMAHVGTLLALADTSFLYFAPVLDDVERFIKCTVNKTPALPLCGSQ